ncbi:MAG: ABC transporter ATP-binding protein, partial [Treponema sp.]|nr:ABC transporter ATP-binding protein [Treponema sp.]
MSILKNLTSGLERKYVVNTILSPVTMIGEVLMETYIPFIMAKIIDIGIAQKDISYVVKTGILMVGCAILSLVCGTLGARFSAVASQGFSHNLRRKIFNKVQSYSFKNLDKFSTASLVTRLTTDVTNTQNVYQMIIRICVRSPFMLIAGSIMAFQIDSQLALLFLIAIPILAVSIIFISSKAHPRFEKMLKKFDKLNATIQENLIGIRVVKAYVRGDYEEDKFKKAADDVRKTQADAERIIIFLMPIMQIVMYFSIIAVMWFGGKKVIFGNMLSGELISFFTYVTQILTSLMMLGMIFVSIVMSQASVSRINEVLNESPDIESPKANPIMDVKDGSINFDNVSFSYNGKKDNYVLQNINLSIQ